MPPSFSPLLATAEEGKKENGDVEKLFSPSALTQKKMVHCVFREKYKRHTTCSERVPEIQRLISRVFILFRVLNN